jgi:hypothetical protein
LNDSPYAISPWDADHTLKWFTEKAILPDLPRYARQHEDGLAPCNRDWLKKRLAGMAMAFGHERDPDRVAAWLSEMGRLLIDLPQDILAHAIDEAIKRSERGFMPGVGPIRAIADPMLATRRQQARRLRTLVDMSRGTKQPGEDPALPSPDGENVPPDQVAELNDLMKRVGLKTRYRDDGTPYQLERAEKATGAVFASAKQHTATPRPPAATPPRMPTEADHIAIMGEAAYRASQVAAQANILAAQVRRHVDIYLSGGGRDDPDAIQFAANHPAEIEAEFARRQPTAPPPSPTPAPIALSDDPNAWRVEMETLDPAEWGGR